MNPFRRTALAAALVVLSTTIPLLAADDDQVKAQAGSWLVAPEDGSKGCHLTFETGETTGGHRLSGAQDCASALPSFLTAAAWTISDDGALSLLDAKGKALARFLQEEGSPWETEDGDPIWLLPSLGAIDRVPSTDSLAGTWQLQTPDGKPLCDLSLQNDRDEDGNARMSLKSACPSPLAEMKLSLWTTEGFGLVLMGDEGSALSFDMNATGNFDKAKEEEGPPLQLMRR